MIKIEHGFGACIILGLSDLACVALDPYSPGVMTLDFTGPYHVVLLYIQILCSNNIY